MLVVNTKKKIVKINVKNIPCYCSIGIHDEEKKMGQKLFIDVSIDADLSLAVSSDNVKDTLSYIDIHKAVEKICKSKSHSLIEALANEIIETFLKHPLILKAKVKVHKPHIPFPGFQGDVSVDIVREK